jgi:hypothetical protein
MRYEVYRQGQPVEVVEADNFRLQEVGRREGIIDRTPGVAHYVFYNEPDRQYGQSISVAAFSDVVAIRRATSHGPAVVTPIEEPESVQ